MIEGGTLIANALVGQRYKECDQRGFLFLGEV
jgi:hypothetical protein